MMAELTAGCWSTYAVATVCSFSPSSRHKAEKSRNCWFSGPRVTPYASSTWRVREPPKDSVLPVSKPLRQRLVYDYADAESRGGWQHLHISGPRLSSLYWVCSETKPTKPRDIFDINRGRRIGRGPAQPSARLMRNEAVVPMSEAGAAPPRGHADTLC